MAHLTKEQLRDTIVAHGIEAPALSSAKKDEFLAIYESQGLAQMDSGLYSSDDEAGPSTAQTKSSRKSVSRSNKSKKSFEEVLAEVSSLSDDDLFQELKSFNVDIGPIVESTRVLYQKKLAKLRHGDEPASPTNGNNKNNTDTNGHANGNANGSAASGNGMSTLDKLSADEESEDDQPAPVLTKKAATKKVSDVAKKLSNTASSIRQRFTRPDDLNSSNERFTPTPRRSIHSVKVTETTKHTRIRDRDGQVSHDYSYERKTEEDDYANQTRSVCSRILKVLPVVFLLLVIAAAVYYSFNIQGKAKRT